MIKFPVGSPHFLMIKSPDPPGKGQPAPGIFVITQKQDDKVKSIVIILKGGEEGFQILI